MMVNYTGYSDLPILLNTFNLHLIRTNAAHAGIYAGAEVTNAKNSICVR